MVDVAIVGAPGYAGVELTRLVSAHPEMRLVLVTSDSEAGKAVADVYPALTGYTDLHYEPLDIARIESSAELVFLAVPHTASLAITPRLRKAGLRVVDASADYRLKDKDAYETWYGVEHTSFELAIEAVYGLPELDRSALPGAMLIACPGCYPTASLLAAIPALEAGIVAPGPIVVDAKSGVSGAGRTPGPATHHPAVNESFAAYKVSTHRHTPEIEQGMSLAAGREVKVAFAPHLVPMTRGLESTVYLPLARMLDPAGAVALYRERYAGEPFISVHEPGRMPATSEVRGGNRAHIGVAVDPAGLLVVSCVIDNLIKGTSGQAVQCANIALGLDETAGLSYPPPVI